MLASVCICSYSCAQSCPRGLVLGLQTCNQLGARGLLPSLPAAQGRRRERGCSVGTWVPKHQERGNQAERNVGSCSGCAFHLPFVQRCSYTQVSLSRWVTTFRDMCNLPAGALGSAPKRRDQLSTFRVVFTCPSGCGIGILYWFKDVVVHPKITCVYTEKYGT